MRQPICCPFLCDAECHQHELRSVRSEMCKQAPEKKYLNREKKNQEDSVL